jgi:hypothetical protein
MAKLIFLYAGTLVCFWDLIEHGPVSLEINFAYLNRNSKITNAILEYRFRIMIHYIEVHKVSVRLIEHWTNSKLDIRDS